MKLKKAELDISPPQRKVRARISQNRKEDLARTFLDTLKLRGARGVHALVWHGPAS